MRIQPTSLFVWLLLVNVFVGFVFNPIHCQSVEKELDDKDDDDNILLDENNQELSSTNEAESNYQHLPINDGGDTTKAIPSSSNTVGLDAEFTDSSSTLTTSHAAKTTPTLLDTSTITTTIEILADKNENSDQISTNLTPDATNTVSTTTMATGSLSSVSKEESGKDTNKPITTVAPRITTPKPNAISTTESVLDLLDKIESKKTDTITKEDLKQLAKIIKLNNSTAAERLQKLTNKLNRILDNIKENRGHIYPERLINEFIDDPVRLKNIPVDKSDGWFSSYTGQFSNVTMYGIRNVNIKSIKTNVNRLDAKIFITIGQIYLTGNYQLDGTVSFVSINGEGPFRFNISDMEIEAYGSLKRSGPDNSGLSIEEIQLDMNADEVQLNLENFEVLGSEVIAQTIISAMSDLIFGRVKNTIIEKASNKIKTLINKRLEKISLNKLLQNNSEVLFDDIVVTVAKRIKHRVDPVPLPPFRRSSSIKVLNMIPVNFSFEVKQGKLYGLTTFARMGDIYVIYEDESALIEAEVGFHNLTGKYHWQLNVLGQGPSGWSSLAIREVKAYLRMRQQLVRGAVPILEQFKVKEIDNVWIEMKGLGIWDHLIELIVNSISNIFRINIANLITSTVTKILQQSLHNVQFSFIP